MSDIRPARTHDAGLLADAASVLRDPYRCGTSADALTADLLDALIGDLLDIDAPTLVAVRVLATHLTRHGVRVAEEPCACRVSADFLATASMPTCLVHGGAS